MYSTITFYISSALTEKINLNILQDIQNLL